MTGDIHLAFDRLLPAIETAGALAASAAVPTALEAVFARCVFAQMFTPPPPRFSSPARSRASLFRFNPPRLRRAAARAAVTPLASSHRERADYLPGLPSSGIFYTNFSHPLRSTGQRRCAPRLPRRRWLTPAIPIDRGPAAAVRAGSENTPHQRKEQP